jgi:hypothetical protein
MVFSPILPDLSGMFFGTATGDFGVGVPFEGVEFLAIVRSIK